MARTYTCAACGGTFDHVEGWDADAEAAAVFTPEELEDAVVVCDDCWRAMRQSLPDMDARYAKVAE